jgi:hypothetical protein
VTIILKSIEEEVQDCIAAFEAAGTKVGDLVNFCHHQHPVEILTEDFQNRIDFIVNNKQIGEIALRLRLFRPIKTIDNEAFDQAEATYRQARIDYSQAEATYRQARIDYSQAEAAYDQARAALNQAYITHFKEIFGVEWQGDIFKTFKERPTGDERDNHSQIN